MLSISVSMVELLLIYSQLLPTYRKVICFGISITKVHIIIIPSIINLKKTVFIFKIKEIEGLIHTIMVLMAFLIFLLFYLIGILYKTKRKNIIILKHPPSLLLRRNFSKIKKGCLNLDNLLFS